MSCERIFLDPRRPALPAAVDWLCRRYGRPGTLDLRPVILAVPSGHARWRLRELLLDRIERDGAIFIPPTIVTPKQLPELLYTSRLPFASELTQSLVWARVLQTTKQEVRGVFHGALPKGAADPRWVKLGQMLARQHRELAGHGLDFAAVVREFESWDGYHEAGRWRVLTALQAEYHKLLDSLDLWDIQTARLVAVRQEECRTERDIVLVGTTDLNEALRRMLDQTARQSPERRIVSLVHASEAWAGRFDEYGSVVSAAWTDEPIDLGGAEVLVADQPLDQAAAVAEALAGLSGKFAAEQITIALPDQRLAPAIERQMASLGVPVQHGIGRLVRESGPARLLEAVAEHFRGGRFAATAALLRHPDVGDALARANCRGTWLAQLDEYYNEHLPARLPAKDEEWLLEDPEHDYWPLRIAARELGKLLKPLRGARRTRPIAEWVEPIEQFLIKVYSGLDVEPETNGEPEGRTEVRPIEDALVELGRTLSDLAQTPADIAPELDLPTAIDLVLEQLGDERLSPASGEHAIELIGWLDMPLDDAPAAIVTSVNDGYVPTSTSGDLFLPNALRTKLGIDDNARRYARDACAFASLLASRQRVTLVVGRRDAEGNPLLPSRLLFATGPREVPERILRYFKKPDPRPPAAVVPPPPKSYLFRVPPPAKLEKPIERISVTSFKSFLACRYRWYLRNVLWLQAIDDRARELEAGPFGTLLHDVLGHYGVCEVRDSTESDVIADVLHQELERCAEKQFGPHRPTAVRIQLDQLAQRLRAFAVRQAARAAEGWRIKYTETGLAAQNMGRLEQPLVVDGVPITLTGRIDRIDEHEDGRIAIFDYKSAEAGRSPEQMHRTLGEWVDLQLPLYRHLVKGLGIEGPCELGYITLPRDLSAGGFVLAGWTEGELAAADEVAWQVVRELRAETFWPPTSPAPIFSEEFATICQDGVFGRPIPGREETP